MKIVDVSAFYTPLGGGVRTYVDHKLEYAAQAGLDMAIIVPGRSDGVEQRAGGGRLISIASPKLPFDGRYRYFRAAAPVHAILDAEQPDIVEASSPWRTANIVAHWQGNARKAMVMHADPMSTYAYRWFGSVAARDTIDRGFAFYWNHLRRAAEQFDLTICANPSLAGRMADAAIPRVKTLPLGIEADRFSPLYRSEELRARLLDECQLPEHAHLLLGVGRLSAEKRWPMIVEAVAHVSAQSSTPIGLVLIGQGRDRASILKTIGGNPHIRLIDGIQDRGLLSAIMASADGLIHGCESETFGLVVAEAAASGLPLILPDEGGATGFAASDRAEVYRAADGKSLAKAIARFFARDHSSLRASARAVAPQILSIKDHFDALMGAYANLGDKKVAA